MTATETMCIHHIRVAAREIAARHGLTIFVRKGTGSMRGTILLNSEHEHVPARLELLRWLDVNGYQSWGTPIAGLVGLSEKWAHGLINIAIVA